MQTIDTAPRDGRLIRISHADVGEFVMGWNARRQQWEGQDFSPMGRRAIYWDASVVAPTHWREVAH